MSNLVPPRPRPIGKGRSFAIVASRFNERYVQGLIDHATAELRTLAPNAQLDLHQVPGAFEIPVVVREIVMQKRADAVLALGVILKGSTPHADHLAHSVTDALQQLALQFGIPVIHAVLSVADETQARERCLGDDKNRGIEAARAAVAVASVLTELRSR